MQSLRLRIPLPLPRPKPAVSSIYAALATKLSECTPSDKLLALAIVSPWLTYAYSSFWTFSGWLALAVGVCQADKWLPPRWLLLCLMTVLLSALVAIPSAALWGFGYWQLSLSVALGMLPWTVLVIVRLSPRVLTLVAPVFVVHGLVVITQGIVLRERVSGLIHNPNLAAGILVLGITYFLTGKHRWLCIPLLVALPFTGSRWGSIVAVLMVGIVFILRQPAWRPVLVSLAIVVACIWVTWHLIPQNYRLVNTVEENTGRVVTDMTYRLRNAEGFRFTGLPMGVNGSDGIHSAPVRVAVEWGILAAITMVALTTYALLKRPVRTQAWWLLLAWSLLGILDYYPVMPNFIAWWFLLLGMRLVEIINPAGNQAGTPETVGKANPPEEASLA